MSCHRSQLAGNSKLGDIAEEQHERIWGIQEFNRVWSFVNVDRGRRSVSAGTGARRRR
jgi:hypothetical protein